MTNQSKILPNSLYGQYNASATYVSADRASAASRQIAQIPNSKAVNGVQNDDASPQNLAQIFSDLTQAYAASSGGAKGGSGGGSASQKRAQNGGALTPNYPNIALLNGGNDPVNAVLSQSADTHQNSVKSSYAQRANDAADSAQQARAAQRNQQNRAQQNRAQQLRRESANAQQDQQNLRADSALSDLAAAPSANASKKNVALNKNSSARTIDRAADNASESGQTRADPSTNQDAITAASATQAARNNDDNDSARQNAVTEREAAAAGQQTDETAQDQAARSGQNSGTSDQAENASSQYAATGTDTTDAVAALAQNLDQDTQATLSNAQSNQLANDQAKVLADALAKDLAKLNNDAKLSQTQSLQQSAEAQIGGQLADGTQAAELNATGQIQTSAQGADKTPSNGQTAANLALTTQLQTIMSGAGMSARIGGNGGTANNSANGTAATNGLVPTTSLVALAEQIDQSSSEQMGDGLAGNLGRDLSAAQQAKGQEKALLLGQNGSDLDFSQVLTGANGSAGHLASHQNLASNVAPQNGTTQTGASNSRLLPLVDQVARPVFLAATQGQNEISIQMQPYSLGRVNVAMKFGQDGKVTAHVTAERPETLALLKNDASGLQQALQDAGFQADLDGLNFSLSSDGRGQQFQTEQQNSGNQGQNHLVSLQEIDEADLAWQSQPSNSLVDISI